MELTVVQIAIIGLVAVVLIQIIKLLAAKLGVVLSKFWVSVVAMVFSIALAVVWQLPKLPVVTDPLEFLLELLQVVGGVVGFATLIYNLLLEKLLDGLGLTVARFLRK